MSQNTEHDAGATAYAKALLELAETRGRLEAVGAEMKGVGEAFEANPTFRKYVADPSVSATERSSVLEKAFAGQLSQLTMGFLKLVNSKHKLALVPAIADAFDRLLDEKLGKIEVDVTVPAAMSPGDLEDVRQRVGRALKKEAVIHQYIDPSIIGGLILRVGDQVIDGSVKAQLEALRRKLVATQN